MKRFFPPEQNFQSLSIKDLLEARDTFHVHLFNKENVIATAIGKFLIRIQDPDSNNPSIITKQNDSPPRTLENTVVKPWSWPCILVFVKQWLTREQLKGSPDQVVPSFVYMPDGRVIPLCVIYSPIKEIPSHKLTNLTFTSHLMGGGYPVISNVQGQERIGTIGCLVTDGDSVFALTNKHVTGDSSYDNYDHEKKMEIYTIINGKQCKIGNSYPKQLGKKLFSDVYSGWPGGNVYSNLDAGLVKIEDITNFSAQVFGIGEMDELVDLNTSTLSLDLIGCPVRAFGGASGQMIGEIQALFYRYKSLGGFDYVSDLVIGQISNADTGFITQPGDSGTLWFYDPRLLSEAKEINLNSDHKFDDKNTESKTTHDGISNSKSENSKYTQELSIETIDKNILRGLRAVRLRPLALQCGGQVLMNEKKETELNFALATCLSTIYREMDIDIIRNWNIGHSEYWGKLAHYKIGAKACDLLSNQKLSKLMKLNLSRIAFDDDSITSGGIERFDSNGFVPLADVADLVWKKPNGRPKDEANHFADMDQEGEGNFEGRTLFDLIE